MNKKFKFLLALVMLFSVSVSATACGGGKDDSGSLNLGGDDYEGPKAKIERITTEDLAAYNASGITVYGTSETVEIETGYIFSIEGNAEDYADSKYIKWNADYFVSFDKAIAENTVCLAGSYDTWENGAWLAFWITGGLEAGETIQLLGSANVKVNCEELYTMVKDFKCGAMSLDVNDGTTMKVELRLMNPADETDYVVVSRTEYKF